MPSPRDLSAAALLGGVIGQRSFSGPAALAVRGRLGEGPLRIGAIAGAVGEVLADKAPIAPPRTTLPSLGFRLASGAYCGRVLAGTAGAGVGALAAVAGTYGTYPARTALTEMTGLPNAVVGVAEDAIVFSAAALATRPSDAEDEPESESKAVRAARAVVRGAAAGVFGTLVMTGAQLALHRAMGQDESRAPERVGRKVLGRVFGTRVSRGDRDALNQAMHWGYGTSWGVDYAVTAALAGGRPPVLAGGAGLGLTAWTASLIQLPAFDAAPPVWRQPPGAVAADAALHVVFGLAVAAAVKTLP